MYQAAIPQNTDKKDGISILIAKKDSEHYKYAQMHYCDKKKIYFESPFEPEIGSEINIIIEFYSPCSSGPGAHSCRGIVLQCREKLEGYTFNYGVDVRICEEV